MPRNSLLCLAILLTVIGCGGDDAGSAKLKIASMQSPSRRSAHSRAVDVIASSTAYSFATVDGIKVKLIKLRGQDAASDNPLVTIDFPSKEIELSGDPDQAIALDETITWKAGNFRGMDFHFENNWKVKAHCKTRKGTGSGFLTYTTANGVETITCSRDDCSTLPADYDYTSYEFLSTYSEYISANDYNQDTHYKFTVAAGTTPIVTALYDGTFNVVCWDGSTWSSSDAIGAFRGPSTDAERQEFWPNGTPAMATGYLPFFGYLTTDSSEAIPTARTFLASTDSTKVDTSQAAFEFGDAEVMTLVYKSDGTILTGSARNTQGTGSSSPLEMEVEGFTQNGSAWDFYASGWYWAGTIDPPQFIRNNKFVAFSPPTTLGTTFSTTFEDGPDCGKTFTDFQNNNASRACLGGGTFYWREMER